MCVLYQVRVIECDSCGQSTDLTDLARQGKLDPTIGRDDGLYSILLKGTRF